MGVKKMNYLEHVLNAIDINKYAGIKLDWTNLTEDQITGLKYAVSRLSDNEQEVLRLRYECKMTFRAIGEQKGISGARAGQIHEKAVYALRKPSQYVWFVEGYNTHNAKREADVERVKQHIKVREDVCILEKSCRRLGIPERILVKLQRAGFETIGQLQSVMKKYHWEHYVTGIGIRSADILVCRMVEMGLVGEKDAAVREYQKRKNARTNGL